MLHGYISVGATVISPPPPRPMFAVDTRLFDGPDFRARLDELYGLGVDSVQLSTRHVEDWGFIGAVREAGLRVVQVHTPHEVYEGPLAAGDREVLGRFEEWFDTCRKLDCDIAVVHLPYRPPTRGEGTPRYVEALRRASMEAVGMLVRLGEEHGVRVAVENRLERAYGYVPADLLEVVRETGAYMCLDVGHANVNGVDILEAAAAMPGRVATVHVHDNDGRTDQHLPPLLGTVDWGRLLTVMGELGYGGPYVMEVAPIGQRRNLARLVALVGRELFG